MFNKYCDYPSYMDTQITRVINIAVYIREPSKYKSIFKNSVKRQLETIKSYISSFGIDIHLQYIDNCKDNHPYRKRLGAFTLESGMCVISYEKLERLQKYTKSNTIKEMFEPSFKYFTEDYNIEKHVDDLLKVNISHKDIDIILVESFSVISREYDILRDMRENSKESLIPIISAHSKRLLTSYSDNELKIYSDTLKEEKSLFNLKYKPTEYKINKKLGRKNNYLEYFNNPLFIAIWKENKLDTLSYRKIQDILFINNYKTVTGTKLALGTVSILKKYYINTIMNS